MPAEIDLVDLTTIADDWMETKGFMDSDLYPDHKIDLKDFSVLANHWLKNTD
jgi:hypothetical protein